MAATSLTERIRRIFPGRSIQTLVSETTYVGLTNYFSNCRGKNNFTDSTNPVIFCDFSRIPDSSGFPDFTENVKILSLKQGHQITPPPT